MARYIGTLLLSILLLIDACGCAGTTVASTAQFQKEPQPGITGVVLNDYTRVEFVPVNGEVGSYVDGEIVGITKSREKVHIPVTQVREVWYNNSGHANTAILVGGALVAVGAIVYWLATLKVEIGPLHPAQ